MVSKGILKPVLAIGAAIAIIAAYFVTFTSESAGTAPLPGWLMLTILLAIGGILTFAVYAIGRGQGTNAEDFLTGGRGIGHGMTNASIVATWIWAATLMTSSLCGYAYGYIGPWWYGLGAVLPLPIIGILGTRLRRVMPMVRSYPEFISFRLDKKNHVLLTIITIIVSFVVAVMIVSGASVMAVGYANIPFWLVALVLLVIFVSYTSMAGLWASIFSDTIMTMFMYAAMLTLILGVLFKVGPGAIYDGIVEVIQDKPVLRPDQPDTIQSYQWNTLAINNKGGLAFLCTNIIGNLGAVICNQTYWGRSIAAKDEKTIIKSFGSAAFCWTPVPIMVGMALGLYALSQKLTVGQSYSLGNITMMFNEADTAAPLSAFLVMGFVGLLAFVIATLGASISTGAGEIMSISTCAVNDVYKGHINKNATDRQILILSRVLLIVAAIVVYIVVMFLRSIGFPFSSLYQAMGIAFSSAVIPVILALLWKRTNRNGVFAAIIIGALAGISYWIYSGFDMTWGVVVSNIAVVGISALVVIVWSIIRPENFDYSALKNAGINVKNSSEEVE